MAYKLTIEQLGDSFDKAWRYVDQIDSINWSRDTEISRHQVEKYFQEHYQLTLIKDGANRYHNNYAWEWAIFKNKGAFVLFKLIWG